MISKPNHTRVLDGRPEQRMGLQQHLSYFDAALSSEKTITKAYFSEK
jgi:hypothetical protein